MYFLSELNSIESISGMPRKAVFICSSSHVGMALTGMTIRSIGPRNKFIKYEISFARLITGVPDNATTLQFLAL